MEKAVDSRQSSRKILISLWHTVESAREKLDQYIEFVEADGRSPRVVEAELPDSERKEIKFLIMAAFASSADFPKFTEERRKKISPKYDEEKIALSEAYLRQEIERLKKEHSMVPFNHREWHSIHLGEPVDCLSKNWDPITKYRNAIEISAKLHPNIYKATVEIYKKTNNAQIPKPNRTF